MTTISAKTLTVEQNKFLLIQVFGKEFAREVMKEEKRLGVKRPTAPIVNAF